MARREFGRTRPQRSWLSAGLVIGASVHDSIVTAIAALIITCPCALALAHANATFLGELLRPVRDAIALSRQGRTLMRQNLWLAVIYNAIAVPVAILGFVTPLIAAAEMCGSSVLVTLNALPVRGGAR